MVEFYGEVIDKGFFGMVINFVFLWGNVWFCEGDGGWVFYGRVVWVRDFLEFYV